MCQNDKRKETFLDLRQRVYSLASLIVNFSISKKNNNTLNSDQSFSIHVQTKNDTQNVSKE